MKGKVILFLFINYILIAQDRISFFGEFKNNTKYAKVVLKKYGLPLLNIAEAKIENDTFSFYIPDNIETGIYRLQYSQVNQNEYINIIVNGKEKKISFELDLNQPEMQPHFLDSEENKKWYEYEYISFKQLQKINVLNNFIGNYPFTKDLIFTQAKTAYLKEKSNYIKHFEKFVLQNKNTWAAEMVSNKPYFFNNPEEQIILQNYYKRINYWNNINTSNPKLINSPLYTDHILNYLKYYMNPDMHYTELEVEEGFKKSVDTIIQKFSGNILTKKFALQYLQLGFKEIGQEKVLQYIDEKYKDFIEQCVNENQKEEFEKRIKGYESLKPGNIAPNIFYTDIKGNVGELKNIISNKIIIVFWSSTCPHCELEMPKLHDFIKQNTTIVALAVSLDRDKNVYKNAILKYPELIHTCDFMEWNGKTVKDYFIYGSPTFILLDKEKKIIGKYTSWDLTLKNIEF